MQIIQAKSIMPLPPPKKKTNEEKTPLVINYLDGSKPSMYLGLKNLNVLASLNYVIQDLIHTTTAFYVPYARQYNLRLVYLKPTF